jgi:hypothetical protein
MGKSHKWACEKIVRQYHAISELELEQRLAELWEILLKGKSQFRRSQELVPLKSSSPFLPEKRSKR